MKSKYLLLLLGLATLIGACTPKVTEEAQTTSVEEEKPTPPPAPEEDLSPCPKFSDAPDPDQASTDYVLYRDFLKAGDWEKAFERWQKVYAVSPAADGRRNTVYADGIRFYERFLAQTQDEAKKEEYIDQIFVLYDQVDECYPKGGYIVARKAFDYYYKYKDRASKEEVYAMFKESIDTDGLETPDFVLNPFTSLLVDLYFAEKISLAEAKTYQQKVRDILAKGLAECGKTNSCERWKIIEEYTPARLEAFEGVRGFYDCEYYKAKFYADFEANPQDCDVLRTVYSRLNWGGCPESDEDFRRLIRAGNENCAPKTGAKQAYLCLQEADYDCAIEEFEKAAADEENTEKKANYLLLVGKIYYTHLKNFSKARQYALQAAEVKPDWGEPYLLIGRLYASSGPLCGPGRGWDSQIVVWPAIDMWIKAKRIDPDARAEANKWIGRYSQYMPSIEDIFQRNLKEGDPFRVPCWIQENTTIRAAR